tara:strand:+ start:431 stop:664 length:234 start_codon:yes stop_codon:yes gene_type:complete
MSRRKINRGHVHRQELRERAVVLEEERSNRTPQQQLAVLDQRLGEGVGAVRERQRLHYLIDNPPHPKKEKKNGRSTK